MVSTSHRFSGLAAPRLALLAVLAVVLTACEIAAYSPYVAGVALGLDKEDLGDQPPYSDVLDRTLMLADGETSFWTLRRFSSGNEFIQYSPQLEDSYPSTEMVMRLDGCSITVVRVYNDSYNGGTYFDALLHRDGAERKMRRIHWQDELLQYRRLGEDQDMVFCRNSALPSDGSSS